MQKRCYTSVITASSYSIILSSMKVDLQPGFILHQRAYRETSLILEVFSPGFGRTSLVARGAKRGKASQAALLQPARKLNLAWTIRSEMGTLISAEPDGPGMNMAGRTLFCCFYLNELLMRMLHRHESHPELFYRYEQTLLDLQQGVVEDKVLRVFEKHLLKSLGYGLILDHDIQTGRPVEPDGDYYYLTASGPQRDRPGPGVGIQISGRTLQALASETDWDEQISKESKRLLRAILNIYTGERPLASRALFRSYLQHTGKTG